MTRRFQCLFCSNPCSILSKFEVHLRSHTGERPFSCKICSKSFKQKGNLSTHLKIHTQVPKPYKCDRCPISFSIETRLKTHLVAVHNVNNLPKEECAICWKKFTKGTKMNGHMLRCHTQTEKVHECPVCKKSSKTLRALEDHIRIHTGERPFACSECPARFPQKSQLTSHLARKHGVGVRLRCPVCNKNIYGDRDLVVHMRSHTNEKPFSCTICSKSFTTPGNLKSHTRVHSRDKRFSCNICGKQFSSPLAYKAHCQRHTGQTMPYQCAECQLSFYTPWKLKTHVDVVHRNIRRYSCSLCGESFQSNANRDRHLKTHLNETPHKCELCGKRFAYRESVTRHVKAMHSNSAEQCPCSNSKCSLVFNSDLDLLRHYLKVHVGSTEDVMSCFFCKYKVRSMTKLEFHLTKHTHEQPYSCSVCHLSFGSSDNRKSHIQRMHTSKITQIM